jgi:predicted DNA binding CopG/RHH family protein
MRDNLDKEEKELLNSFVTGEWDRIPNHDEELTKFKEIATEILKKDQRINIRISGMDLREIKRKAVEEGIPYQTLVSSILHKYVSGRLVDKAV